MGDKVTTRRVEKQVKRKEEKKRGRVKDRRKRDINKGETRRIKVTIEVKNEWKGMNYIVGTKVERKIRKEW